MHPGHLTGVSRRVPGHARQQWTTHCESETTVNVDTHFTTIHRTEQPTAGTARQGPFARIVVASLGAGLAIALTLTLVVFAGHSEATIPGALLGGFALGWAMIGVLSRRFTDRP